MNQRNNRPRTGTELRCVLLKSWKLGARGFRQGGETPSTVGRAALMEDTVLCVPYERPNRVGRVITTSVGADSIKPIRMTGLHVK